MSLSKIRLSLLMVSVLAVPNAQAAWSKIGAGAVGVAASYLGYTLNHRDDQCAIPVDAFQSSQEHVAEQGGGAPRSAVLVPRKMPKSSLTYLAAGSSRAQTTMFDRGAMSLLCVNRTDSARSAMQSAVVQRSRGVLSTTKTTCDQALRELYLTSGVAADRLSRLVGDTPAIALSAAATAPPVVHQEQAPLLLTNGDRHSSQAPELLVMPQEFEAHVERGHRAIFDNEESVRYYDGSLDEKLYQAVQALDDQAVISLLKQGANQAILTEGDRSFSAMAIQPHADQERIINVLRALFHHGRHANPFSWNEPIDSSPDQQTLLIKAVRYGLHDVAKFLLSRPGVHPGHTDGTGLSAVDWARITRQPRLMRYLQSQSIFAPVTATRPAPGL